MISYRPSAKFDKSASILFITKEQADKNSFSHARNSKIQSQISSVVKQQLFSGEQGEIFPLVTDKRLVLLAGVGPEKSVSATSLRIAVRHALSSSSLKRLKDIEIIAHEQSDRAIKAIIEGNLIGNYTWKKYKSTPKDSKTIDNHDLFVVATKKREYDETEIICSGVTLTRDLINDNADLITSTYVEKIIKDLVKGRKNITVEILGQKEMERKGLGLHLAVNRGSNKEPRLIIVKYNGAGSRGDYTALIGKGVTFDTGGLNLKPTGSMETMRCDMSGTAAVVGTLKNTLALNLKVNAIFVMALAENAIGKDAFKPGDVFRGYSGKTVEILNTDAEGRLVLADAIAYVVKNYKPNRIIDIATLTGACVVALGNDYTGLVSTDDDLAKAMLRAAEDTDDRAWRLPTYPEMKDYVKSRIADIKNVGLPKGAAGALTAAEFLRQFTENTPWAHLDIAGTAFSDGAGRFYYGHGATGAGVRLLTEYLRRNV